ncbi:LuxR family transcriptional regulator [Lentzea sp. NPDC051838]|uniref:helix-turn-helix transcriptional regulator n=1 Tax=Lentzea sp. NPDC051838 TaxID=3154849 RepID=UPI0034169E87
MRLVDREFQLTQLDRMLGDVLLGRGRVALVSGALGSGKTVLLHELADRAAHVGANFVSAAGSWAERGLRFGVLGQIVPGADLLAVSFALRQLAGRTPLVIGVDDVDLADQPSLTGLLSLVRRLQSARVLFLFTECAQVRSTFRAELLRLPRCAPVILEPLTEPGVAALHGTSRARRLHALSRGNPLLVDALAAADLPRAVVRCLHRAGPTARHTAQAIAVLGEFATPIAISALTGIGRHAVVQALRVLTASGLLDGCAFRLPGTRDTVLDDVPPVLHTRAARLLHDQGESAEAIACRLLDGPPLRQPWAVAALRTAASRAQRTAFALRCLEHALKSTVDASEQAAISFDLAQLEFRSNPPAAARHLTALTGHREARLLLVSQLLWHGRVAEARDLLQDNDSEVQSWLASAHPSLARWRPADSPLTSLLYRDDSSAADRAEGFLRGVRLTGDLPWAAVFALLTLVYSDRLSAAASWCDRLLEQAADHVTWQAMFTSVRAEIALRQGDLRACIRLAGVAFRLLSPHAWGTAVVGPLSCLILGCTRAGRLDEAAEHVARPVPEVAFQTRFGPHYLYACGEYHLAASRPDAALADFVTCGDLMASWGQDHPGVVPWRVGAAEALLRQGRTGRARRLLSERLTTGRARGHALRVLASASEPGARTRMLTEAAGLLDDCGDRYGLAQALTDLSEALSHRGRARMTARRARLIADECGAEPLCDRLVPDDLPASESLSGLTGAERRVAALAAAGHTNREIARKLFVTTSTVEQHLTRVYRKLAISYREEIPAGSRPRPRR